jgi:hypothetical protein
MVEYDDFFPVALRRRYLTPIRRIARIHEWSHPNFLRRIASGTFGVWILLVAIVGFRTASLYTLMALRGSGGDWRRSWLGRQCRGG